MLPGRIQQATRVMAEGQDEYSCLAIRDEVIDCGEPLGHQPAMRSAWFPTPEEIARIVAGAPVHLVVLGSGHPPVWLDVGEVPQ